jgi:peroxiredoxin
MRRLAFLVSITALLLMGQGLSGRRAPGFSLPDPGFGQHDLADYRGKWLLIEFMRTDCPHCKMLSKLLETTKGKYGSKFAVLDIVVAPPDNQATVKAYIAENKITNPIVFDQGQVALSYFKATPANPSFDTPHLFAVDPNGNIAHDWTQADVEEKAFPGVLDAMINGKK